LLLVVSSTGESNEPLILKKKTEYFRGGTDDVPIIQQPSSEYLLRDYVSMAMAILSENNMLFSRVKYHVIFTCEDITFIANEPAERRRSAGEAAENSAARRMLYAEKFSIDL